MPFADVAEVIAREQVLAGMERMPPELRAIVDELLQRFADRNEAPLPLAREGAALALWGPHSQLRRSSSVVRFFTWYREQGGLPRVLEILLAALAFERRTYEWDSSAWALARARPARGLDNLGATPWLWLRRELDEAPAAERQATHAIASRGSRSWHVRAALALLFPDDAALWTAADQSELRQADIFDQPSVTFGLLAAMRTMKFPYDALSRTWNVADVLTADVIGAHLGDDAVPALRLIQAVDALARHPDPDAVRALAEMSDLSAAWKPLSTIAPTRKAIAALAAMFTTQVPRRTRGLQLARGLFYELVTAAPGEAAQVDSPVVARAIAETGATLPPDDGWISPWARPAKATKATRSKAKVSPSKVIAFDEVIHWKQGEQEAFAASGSEQGRDAAGDARQETLCRHEASSRGKSFVFHLGWMTDEGALRLWKSIEPKQWYGQVHDIEELLARFGLAELETIIAFVRTKPDTLGALVRVESPRVAPLMARGFALIKKQHDVGKRWLDRFPEAAAIGLVTDTQGDKKQRDANAKALAYLLDKHPKIVAVVMEKAGASATTAELAEAAAAVLPARAPKLPAFLDLERLPRPIRTDGTALQGAALGEFAQLLKAGLADGLAIIDTLAARYTPESLARFAWGLFRQWLFAEGPPKEKWMHHVLGKFPDDDNARALGKLARYWAPSGNPTRAQEAVEVLAAMRSQAGLIEIHDIATTVQSKALAARAETVFEQVAESLGIGTAELADRLIPEVSEQDLAFGELRVELDVQLVPRLVAPDGSVVDKPKEDAERYRELKKTCAAVARGQGTRLEQLMAEGVRMKFSHFAELYMMHSLIRHLARGVLWGAYRSGRLVQTFAIAPDGPVDRANQPLEVPMDATYGIVHPAELSDDERTAWHRWFGERGIGDGHGKTEQPVEQLTRAVFPTTSTAAAQAALLKLIGRTVSTARLLELQRRGWRRGESPQGGEYYTISRHGDGWSAELAFTPGIYLGAPAERPTQTIDAIAFDAEPETPIAVLSEIQRDVSGLTAP